MERRTQFNVAYLIFALVAMLVLQQWWQQARTVEVVPYSEFEELLAERLSKYDVKYTRTVESTLLRDLLSWMLPALVFFGVWYLLAKRMAGQQGLGGGFMNIGKSRA